MPLYYRELGQMGKPVLCLLHGLFGASSNLMGIAKRLQDDYHVLVPDLRNHGRSFHCDNMDYPGMAQDLIALIKGAGIHYTSLLGHSMGGKVAMWFALRYPQRVDKLIVADIGPMAYENRFHAIFSGLISIPLERLKTREEADQYLSEWVLSASVRNYLLQNLIKQKRGWSWRFNLSVLQRVMPTLLGFPEQTQRTFPGDTLFIHGEHSNYMNDEARAIIKVRFPHYQEHMLLGAGHWLHAEQPQRFTQVVARFLEG
jgi:pimeloyl-ACP methyl ester carboxylesterase